MEQVDENAWLLRRLAEHRSLGESVLLSARMVGDEEDYAVWKYSRQSWAEAVVTALAEQRRHSGARPARDHEWLRQGEELGSASTRPKCALSATTSR
jgi:hypothetical protein